LSAAVEEALAIDEAVRRNNDKSTVNVPGFKDAECRSPPLKSKMSRSSLERLSRPSRNTSRNNLRAYVEDTEKTLDSRSSPRPLSLQTSTEEVSNTETAMMKLSAIRAKSRREMRDALDGYVNAPVEVSIPIDAARSLPAASVPISEPAHVLLEEDLTLSVASEMSEDPFMRHIDEVFSI